MNLFFHREELQSVNKKLKVVISSFYEEKNTGNLAHVFGGMTLLMMYCDTTIS